MKVDIPADNSVVDTNATSVSRKHLHNDTMRTLETALDDTEKKNRAHRAMMAPQLIRLLCSDWAEAHTHAQDVAKRVGVPEDQVNGNSYGVPGIEELVDMIAAQILPATTKTCCWTRDEDHGHWNGNCGMAFEINSGTLTENEIFYCPKCGGKIHESP